MLELVIVVAIGLVAASMVFITVRDALRNQRAERALQNVLSTTRTARQLAIDRRRVFMVTYDSTANQMTVTVTPPNNSSGGCLDATSSWPDGNAAPPTPILGNYGFAWVAGAPNDANGAPDGLGASQTTAVYFTSTVNPTSICFYPDGSARDQNNQFTSGVVYLSPTVTSENNTTVRLNNMRAMTIFGPTGRISGWRLTQGSSGPQWKMW